VEIREGRIVAVGSVGPNVAAVDVGGSYLAPAFIDSHVHLAYLPLEAEMMAGGVAAAVDLAAPESFLSADHGRLRVLGSGPMITSPGGYPLDSWGKDGYGIGCADAASARSAVDRLKTLGARIIKVPLTDPGPDDATLRAAVERAHELGLKVAVHALSENAAHRGAIAGADVLAHVPVEPMTEETLATWANRTVVSTLSAFGGAAATENARQLRAAGADVLYGTDFGNTMTPGIDGNEIAELVAAGFDGSAILAAGTSLPAAFWGFDDLGAIEVGKRASLLVVADDPLATPSTLASPTAVYVDGELVSSVRSGSTKSQHRAASE
jgi:imidazolonepropionase-like amidohydrolase